MADIVDLNIYPTIETVDVTIQTIIDNVAVTIQPTNNPVNLTITPNLITINVNQVTGGGAVNSVNTLVGDVLLTQDTVLDGSTFKQYSLTEKNKLAGIANGAEVNVNADWNATTGDAQILNKPTIPAAVTQTSQLTNNGADGVNPFITALDIPTTGQASTIVREVKNMTGATLTKGTVVYISGANGNKALVSKALATTDALSSRTFGLLQSNILNNGLGYCVIIGDLSGLDTSTFADGDQLYLSGVTAGTYTATKILAPTHLVYVGKVTRSHPTLGQIEVGIQNGYELSEIHDVALSSVANNNILSYTSATNIWENKTVETALGFTPANDSNVVHLAQIETITGQKTFNPSVTAASLIAKGTVLTPTLVASANSDVLVGLDIAPTFTNGAFTGVTNYALRVGSSITPNINSTHNIGGGGSLRFANGYFSNTLYTSFVRGTQLLFGDELGGNYMKIFTSGNVTLQNNGTFTDVPSSRLTVNSTTQGFLPPRMTTTQRNAIASPATGLLVYDTTLLSQFQYNGTAWVSNTLGYTPFRFTKPTEIVHTGVLTETILQTILIPANTFSNGDFIMFSALVSKLANIGSTTHYLKINTTNTLVGASLLAQNGFNTVNFFAKIKREFVVNGGNIYGYTTQVSTQTNDQAVSSTTQPINTVTYNLAADMYFFVTCQLGNILDTITYRGINFYKQ